MRRAKQQVDKRKELIWYTMQKIQFITFDAAGTLIAPHPTVGEIYADTLRARGIDCEAVPIEKKFRESFGQALAKSPESMLQPRVFWKNIVQKAISGYCPDDQLDAVFETLWNRFGEGRSWCLLKGTKAALTHLRSNGFRLGVLSNNDSRLHGVLEDLGILPFFEQVFVSAELGYSKPDTQIFKEVETALKLPPSALLHVGDDPIRDEEAARKAGWSSILVAEENGPDWRVKDLGRIPNLLAGVTA